MDVSVSLMSVFLSRTWGLHPFVQHSEVFMLSLTTPHPAYCPLQQPRKRCCFFSSLSAGSEEAARWQRGFHGISNRRGEEQAVNSFLENKVSGECFFFDESWSQEWEKKMILDVGMDTEEASRRVTNDKHPIDIALQFCSHLLHAQSTVRGRWPEPSKSVFNLTLKDTARLWSGSNITFLTLTFRFLMSPFCSADMLCAQRHHNGGTQWGD